MKLVIASKSGEKIFTDKNIINIGTALNCDYRFDAEKLGYDLLFSLQLQENGRWMIVNSFKSNKILFRGQPIGSSLEIGSLCKLMFADTDEFVSIKIDVAGTNPKVVSGSLELANRKNAEKLRRTEPRKTMTMIEGEEINEKDIENLYGSGIGAQTKIKIDKIKSDIEKRRAIITKEIAYKSDYLRNKLAQNEILLSVLNSLIFIIPLSIAMIMKDIIKIETNNGDIQTKLLFVCAIGFIIITFLLKQGQFLTLQNKTRLTAASSKQIQVMSMLVSCGIFTVILVFSVVELMFNINQVAPFICQMLILCTCMCIFLGVFAGFIKNIIAEAGEELDSYQSREDFQAVVKDYQKWIELYVNNISRKKLKDIRESKFNLGMKAAGEYLMGILTAPFLAYGVSQTLAECFSDAAAWVRIESFKFSPIFLTLATLMICFAFHCFSTSFSISKRLHASNVIREDGFSDYNIHGVSVHGIESSKNLKKEARKFLMIALAVVVIELTMNVSYFINEMGHDVQGMVLSFIAALVPTAILIMETTMLGNTKFEIICKQELLDKVDKNY